ncbi:FecR family protein [Flammeovirga pectinis]|uniref:FecR family protein n=1 Tax=Flammeovirga pectinis TaxID=2494373 RepID=A0A3S9P8F9_9BACT|nr:FecR domain-containing protein [Flammeovirga pectinis]AZQ64486.1 FecR family protein [Flammeovirga pectinis]
MSTLTKYVEDPNFCAWALGDTSLDSYWEKYLIENKDEKENIDSAKTFVQKVEVKEPNFSAQRENDLWAKIESNVVTPPKEVKLTTNWWRYGAAVIVLGLVIAFYYRNFVPSHHTEVADRGITKNVVLPDGSTVDLNSDSKISYSRQKWGEGRYLDLQGEAFFNVEKGNIFQVSTELGSVTVLGTSFNIYARDKKWIISCYTGKVLVADRNGKEIILSKGDEAEYVNNGFVHVDHYNQEPTWKKGVFNYENASLEKVFEEIQRQFDVRVIYKNPSIGNMKFTGTITTSSLKTSLEVIAKTMGVNYKINNKEVEVSL